MNTSGSLDDVGLYHDLLRGAYPRKQNKKKALANLVKTVKTHADVINCSAALFNYVTGRLGNIKKGFVLHDSTFFGRWYVYQNCQTVEFITQASVYGQDAIRTAVQLSEFMETF